MGGCSGIRIGQVPRPRAQSGYSRSNLVRSWAVTCSGCRIGAVGVGFAADGQFTEGRGGGVGVGAAGCEAFFDEDGLPDERLQNAGHADRYGHDQLEPEFVEGRQGLPGEGFVGFTEGLAEHERREPGPATGGVVSKVVTKWVTPKVRRGQGSGSCPSAATWTVQAVSGASCGPA